MQMKVAPLSKKKPVSNKVADKTPAPVGNSKLHSIVAEINKKHGAKAVQLGVPEEEQAVDRIRTGSIALDIALGGGIPVGRFTQIAGAYSTGKTTQAVHIMAQAQSAGYICSMQDVEGTSTDPYLTALGVDTSSLLYSRPDSLEECTQMILDYQRSGQVNLAVWDSIISTKPNKVIDKEMGESVQMGVMQVMLDEFFSKFQMNNNRLKREGKIPFTIIGINQLREKPTQYGDPEYTPGGRAKDFASSIDLRLRRGDWLAEGSGENKEIVGQVTKFKIEKNKTYKRMQSGEFDFYFAENSVGISPLHNDNFKSVILESVAWGLIERGGAWYYLDRASDLKFQGVDNLLSYLKDSPVWVEKLNGLLLDIVKREKVL